MRLIDYYENEIKKRSIEVKLGVEVDRKLCGKERPDVGVVATGAEIVKPDIAGIDRENVISAWEVLEGNVETPDTVAVIGGGKVGLVTAEHLASRGKEVWVVESQKRVDYDVSTTFRWRHAAWVKEFGINVLNLTKALEVTDKGLLVKDEKGKQRLIEAGTIILAGPRKSVQDLVSSLEYVCDELYVIGDAIQPRFMHRAIHEGYKLGARL